MTAKSDFLENTIIDMVLRSIAYSEPASVFISLYTTSPAEDDSGTEVSGGNYARLEVGAATGRDFVASSGGATSNNEEWLFNVASGNWGDITHVAVHDALTVGNLLYHGALTATKTINTNDQLKFAAGALDISET